MKQVLKKTFFLIITISVSAQPAQGMSYVYSAFAQIKATAEEHPIKAGCLIGVGLFCIGYLLWPRPFSSVPEDWNTFDGLYNPKRPPIDPDDLKKFTYNPTKIDKIFNALKKTLNKNQNQAPINTNKQLQVENNKGLNITIETQHQTPFFTRLPTFETQEKPPEQAIINKPQNNIPKTFDRNESVKNCGNVSYPTLNRIFNKMDLQKRLATKHGANEVIITSVNRSQSGHAKGMRLDVSLTQFEFTNKDSNLFNRLEKIDDQTSPQELADMLGAAKLSIMYRIPQSTGLFIFDTSKDQLPPNDTTPLLQLEKK